MGEPFDYNYFIPNINGKFNNYEGHLHQDIGDLKKSYFCKFIYGCYSYFEVYDKKDGKHLDNIALFYPKPLLIENKDKL